MLHVSVLGEAGLLTAGTHSSQYIPIGNFRKYAMSWTGISLYLTISHYISLYLTTPPPSKYGRYFRQFDELEGIPVINLHLWFDRKLDSVGSEISARRYKLGDISSEI
jgi:hypothetical protein